MTGVRQGGGYRQLQAWPALGRKSRTVRSTPIPMTHRFVMLRFSPSPRSTFLPALEPGVDLGEILVLQSTFCDVSIASSFCEFLRTSWVAPALRQRSRQAEPSRCKLERDDSLDLFIELEDRATIPEWSAWCDVSRVSR